MEVFRVSMIVCLAAFLSSTAYAATTNPGENKATSAASEAPPNGTAEAPPHGEPEAPPHGAAEAPPPPHGAADDNGTATSDVFDGTATYYTAPYIPSACYGRRIGKSRMIAAASAKIWNHRKACRQFYTVKCIGSTKHKAQKPCTNKTVKVKIVDYCGSRGCGTINLSKEAFAVIANTKAGRIDIQYHQ